MPSLSLYFATDASARPGSSSMTRPVTTRSGDSYFAASRAQQGPLCGRSIVGSCRVEGGYARPAPARPQLPSRHAAPARAGLVCHATRWPDRAIRRDGRSRRCAGYRASGALDSMSCDTTTEPVPGHAQSRGDVGDSHAYDAFLGASKRGPTRRPTRDHDVRPPATAAPHGSTCHVMTRVLGPIILALEPARAALRAATRNAPTMPRGGRMGRAGVSRGICGFRLRLWARTAALIGKPKIRGSEVEVSRSPGARRTRG